MTLFTRFATPLGAVYATATADGLTGLYFEGGRHAPPIAPDWREQPSLPLLHACSQQLAAYLDGRRREFGLPLAPRGTPFQMRVWSAIAAIPFGQMVSYAELARRAGATGSARAAGAATGRNPLSIIYN